MKKPSLTAKESLALQAMVRRAGMAVVLDDLFMLSQERLTAEWQEVGEALYEAVEYAREAESIFE